eukprot:gnl/MRDRNA2_/MRDRNA2_156477_c0_seq1.p1 gnl/MRDRNA2_/MRDRNA2_156477_c0~~gnl/MRDRNA2_/MRDRNA2_156477_c0_seq1.p1  ORF type:complete len:311 (-),score=57.71 gnl/MRDRNA2_/MRDRNA2_156477_c0_seq1:59-991(-)
MIIYTFLLLVGVAGVGAASSNKKVMVWMANPFEQPDHKPPITFDSLVADLQAHPKGFNAIAYQYFAICGAGSNDKGGSNDCSATDATGVPHLAQGHPTQVAEDFGSQLRKRFGSEVELWPVISYGNPGNASVLNALLDNPSVSAKFISDAIKIAHAQNLSGFNFDIETSGVSSNITSFLKSFVSAMHAANPRIGVSYDAGNMPMWTGEPAMDRWISMATYTGDTNAFRSGLAQGMRASGSAFGVGLCPICQVLDESEVEARFAELSKYGDQVHELDMWASSSTVDSKQWQFFWPRLEKWLASAENEPIIV